MGLPAPRYNENIFINKELLRERQYDIEELQTYVENQKKLLVDEQKIVFETIMSRFESGNGGIFFWMHQAVQEKLSYLI